MKLVEYKILAGEVDFSQRSTVALAQAALKMSIGNIRSKRPIGF
jgi:hypothetical protein